MAAALQFCRTLARAADLETKAEWAGALEIYKRLLRRSVIVRPVAGYGLPEHLRVTIGTAEENDRFLAALAPSLRE